MADPDCQKCHGSGTVIVGMGSVANGLASAVPCECAAGDERRKVEGRFSGAPDPLADARSKNEAATARTLAGIEAWDAREAGIEAATEAVSYCQGSTSEMTARRSVAAFLRATGREEEGLAIQTHGPRAGG